MTTVIKTDRYLLAERWTQRSIRHNRELEITSKEHVNFFSFIKTKRQLQRREVASINVAEKLGIPRQKQHNKLGPKGNISYKT